MKKILVFLFLLIAASCIDPYKPNLKAYESLLTVDALITDANTSCSVKLTMTTENLNDIHPPVSDAKVYLTDDEENTSILINAGGGVYKTDSLEFRGRAGRTYVLHIETSSGKEYESVPCFMYPVPEIDKIYFTKDQQLVNNGTQSLDGISIYLDTKEGTSNQFYRWSYEETWKFKVPYPKKYDYRSNPLLPNSPDFIPVKDLKEFCWKNDRSDEVVINSNHNAGKGIKGQKVTFIPTDLTDRFLIQYSIMVNQYSISKEEFEFWTKLIQVNETGDDIFARLPYTVTSNIKNINNHSERVLGYFQVSAVSQKREYILHKDLDFMGLPFYSNSCKVLKLDLKFFGPGCLNCPPWTWDDLYSRLCISNDYTFIEPVFTHVQDGLIYLLFTRPECANCELTGTSKKPDYWVDMQ